MTDTVSMACPEPRETAAGEASPAADLIKIRRSDGREEWVTHRELELLNESKRFGEVVGRLQKQRDFAAGIAAFAILFALGSQLILRRTHEAKSLRTTVTAQAVEPRKQSHPPPVSTPEDLIEAWTDARASRDFESYLGFYSDRFRLPEGMSRDTWEAMRRTRLSTVRRGKLTIEDLETETVTGNQRVVSFVEIYRTSYSTDRVAKTLELTAESGRWRILRERTRPLGASATQGLDPREAETFRPASGTRESKT